MADRDGVIDSFLSAHGWDGAERGPLGGDASFRRYERLTLGRRKAMLMDAPPPQENVDKWVAVARHLKSLGFSAPDIFAEDKENGFLIIEDLGDETFTRVLDGVKDGADDATEAGLYALAVDVLVELHGAQPEGALPSWLEDYDDAKLLDEALLLTDWTWPAVFNDPAADDVREAYGDAWRESFAVLGRQPRTLVLRDYHVDNLMVLDGRQGIARCGLLDFQDALRGPAAYDLMSLLEDARRDIPGELKDAMLARYYDGCGDGAGVPGRGDFEAAFAVLAAQRHAKVIGIFTRLCRRDAKPAYLVHIPRVWRLLDSALGHPALATVAAWFDAHFPPEKRIVPPGPPNPEEAA